VFWVRAGKSYGVAAGDAGTWQAIGGKGILGSITPADGWTNSRKIMLSWQSQDLVEVKFGEKAPQNRF